MRRLLALVLAAWLVLAPAFGALQVTNLLGFSAGGLPLAVYTDTGASTSAATDHTFSDIAIGQASGRSLVVVAAGGHSTTSGRSVDGVTIGGVAATQIASSSGGQATAAIWAAVVPSGTTATIEVSFTGSQDDAGIGVWALYGLRSTTATDTAGPTSAAVDTLDVSVDVTSANVVIAYHFARDSSLNTFTWVGVTERFDEAVDSPISHGGGDAGPGLAVASPRTITTTSSGSIGGGLGAVAATWR